MLQVMKTPTELTMPIAESPSVLSEIYRDEHNIAVWERDLPNKLIRGIKHMLIHESNLALVQTVTPSNVDDWIMHKLSNYECAELLAKDIALIVDMFCCLFDLGETGLRLTSIYKPMCPKFHVDHVPCRLVSTYTGTATEWHGNDGLDRSKLGAGSLGKPDHLSGLYSEQSAINRLSIGDVALLKGSGWEGNESRGLVHRSPQNLNQEPRLLLTLDMV